MPHHNAYAVFARYTSILSHHHNHSQHNNIRNTHNTCTNNTHSSTQNQDQGHTNCQKTTRPMVFSRAKIQLGIILRISHQGSRQPTTPMKLPNNAKKEFRQAKWKDFLSDYKAPRFAPRACSSNTTNAYQGNQEKIIKLWDVFG